MSAYVLVEVDVHDPDAYASYRALSTRAVEQYGGRFVARGGEAVLLEGEPAPGRLVVLEFPDLDAARRWYDSPEYVEARAVRQSAATARLVAVEGVAVEGVAG